MAWLANTHGASVKKKRRAWESQAIDEHATQLSPFLLLLYNWLISLSVRQERTLYSNEYEEPFHELWS